MQLTKHSIRKLILIVIIMVVVIFMPKSMNTICMHKYKWIYVHTVQSTTTSHYCVLSRMSVHGHV